MQFVLCFCCGPSLYFTGVRSLSLTAFACQTSMMALIAKESQRPFFARAKRLWKPDHHPPLGHSRFTTASWGE